MKGIQNTNTGNFSSLLSNTRRFIVPKFQRDYSWDIEHWDDLWQDIVSMIENKDEHYMGYLVLQTNDDKNFYIIDGQQRFTTIILLILATIKNIERLISKGIDADDNRRRVDSLKSMYLGKEDPVTLEYDNVLQLNRNNDPFFKDYIVKLGDLKVRNLKATEKLMKRCFEFFDQKLNGYYPDGKGYASFIQTVVDNLYFTQIIVNDEMNAFRVFETLNARGVQLSSADLLKNYLFMLVDKNNSHSSHIETLEDKWSFLTNNIKAEKLPEFLRYYWNATHKAIRANEVFKTIRKEITSDTEVFALINDMIRYSDVYMALRDENDDLWEEEEVRKLISLLNLFRLKQPYPVLMAAKIYLDDRDFKALLKYIITLCFRYNVICDRNPNDQDTPFNNLSILISREKRVDYALLSSISIEDSEFKNSFQEKSFPYNSRNAQIIRYILGKIEFFKGSQLKVWFNDENASIEHVLPQNYDEKWNVDESKANRLVNRLGNMCLLERSKNRELSDDNYEQKRSVYSGSTYFYAKYIAENFTDWNESSVIKIQKDMANAAVSIWSI